MKNFVWLIGPCISTATEKGERVIYGQAVQHESIRNGGFIGDKTLDVINWAVRVSDEDAEKKLEEVKAYKELPLTNVLL